MEKRSKWLPESMSGALKSLWLRIVGVCVFVFGMIAVFALLFHNPYLDGFATAGSFGNQGVVGNIVGFFRYVIGFIPSLFIFLYAVRFGLTRLADYSSDNTPEYNVLRGFVAVCMGSAGFGILFPSSTFGGMLGALVAVDVVGVLGELSIVLALAFIAVFCCLSGALLHIKWVHIYKSIMFLYKTLRTIFGAFCLMKKQSGVIQDIESVEPEIAYQESDDAYVHKTERTVEKDKAKPAKKTTESKIIKVETHGYKLPDPSFLECSNFGKNVITPELKQNAKAMEIHFAEYGVNGTVVGIRPGPIVTLYEFEPDAGTRMSKVNDTVKDMTRAMATQNIRIAHIPSTHLIGVEMVNLNRQTVKYRSLIEDPAFVNSKYKIPLALGVNIGGNPMYFDLAKMPHMLIAGRTGSGKSVFVQSIITSIVYHFTPDKCKLMIIDPKGVDFGFWDDIPHLITPIVKLDPGAAVNALKWAVREMDERYKRMAVVNARDFVTYNEIMEQKREKGEILTQQVAVGTDEETGELIFETKEIDMSSWPYIVIVIDEVADLMALARKEVEACIQRIAQKARAAGIHLVMATQRPDATTITGVIKANFPTRISFQARSYIDSMTTLGDKGAEQLLACGDMLFSEGGKDAVRIHGAFISDAELTRVGNFLRTQGTPEYANGVTDAEGDVSINAMVVGGQSAAAVSKDAKEADLYEQAKQYVIRDKKPTISYIQRRLSIGYNKAAGFMERMEQDGIVSAPDSNGKRQIL